jgi:ferredoxin
MTVYVDYSGCTGCGACAAVYPRVFEMRDELAWVLAHEPLAEEEYREMARICPFDALRVE